MDEPNVGISGTKRLPIVRVTICASENSKAPAAVRRGSDNIRDPAKEQPKLACRFSEKRSSILHNSLCNHLKWQFDGANISSDAMIRAEIDVPVLRQ
jgi:hypothetical protein